MKKLKILFLLMLIAISGINSYAKGNTFGIGIESTIRPIKAESNINSILVEGSYLFDITSRFAVTPKYGVGVKWSKDHWFFTKDSFWNTTVIEKFGAEVSFRVIEGLSLLTGPEFFFDLAKIGHFSKCDNLSGSWAFGASYQFRRFQLRAAYNVEMYDHNGYGLGKSWTVGLRYFFK